MEYYIFKDYMNDEDWIENDTSIKILIENVDTGKLYIEGSKPITLKENDLFSISKNLKYKFLNCKNIKIKIKYEY